MLCNSKASGCLKFSIHYMFLNIRERKLWAKGNSGGAVESPVQEEVLLSKKY